MRDPDVLGAGAPGLSAISRQLFLLPLEVSEAALPGTAQRPGCAPGLRDRPAFPRRPAGSRGASGGRLPQLRLSGA